MACSPMNGLVLLVSFWESNDGTNASNRPALVHQSFCNCFNGRCHRQLFGLRGIGLDG